MILLSRLNPDKLHVLFNSVSPNMLSLPRRYTLTHSDRTGDLYLAISTDFGYEQISGWYTRLMRDEVLAEWRIEQDCITLHIYCHVCGGIVFGTASLRESIFRRELPLVLEAIRYGDQELFVSDSKLDQVEVFVHFRKSKSENNKIESYGFLGDYKF